METLINKLNVGSLNLIINFLPLTLSTRELIGTCKKYLDEQDLAELKKEFRRRLLDTSMGRKGL